MGNVSTSVTFKENILATASVSNYKNKNTAEKTKFSIWDFFSKCDQSVNVTRIWSHLLKKYLMENFFFVQWMISENRRNSEIFLQCIAHKQIMTFYNSYTARIHGMWS